MQTDITWCDWNCPVAKCERNLDHLDGENMTLDEWNHVSISRFTSCPHYGKEKDNDVQ